MDNEFGVQNNDSWRSHDNDVVGVTYCILCGEQIPVYRGGSYERRVCNDCKEAFKRMKGKLSEKE